MPPLEAGTSKSFVLAEPVRAWVREGWDRRVLAGALGLTILGLLFFWAPPGPLREDRCFSDPAFAKADTSRMRPGVFPPGTRCLYQRADGSKFSTTYVPWAEWAGWIAVVWLPALPVILLVRRSGGT